jgi:hypothetical protein
MIKTPGSESTARIVDEWQGKQRLIAAGIEVPTGQLIATDVSDEIIESLRYPAVL